MVSGISIILILFKLMKQTDFLRRGYHMKSAYSWANRSLVLLTEYLFKNFIIQTQQIIKHALLYLIQMEDFLSVDPLTIVNIIESRVII